MRPRSRNLAGRRGGERRPSAGGASTATGGMGGGSTFRWKIGGRPRKTLRHKALRLLRFHRLPPRIFASRKERWKMPRRQVSDLMNINLRVCSKCGFRPFHRPFDGGSQVARWKAVEYYAASLNSPSAADGSTRAIWLRRLDAGPVVTTCITPAWKSRFIASVSWPLSIAREPASSANMAGA